MGIHGYNSYLACKNTNKKNPKIYKPGKKKKSDNEKEQRKNDIYFSQNKSN